MKYCQRCLIPCNRPNITFDAEGRCNCATAAVKSAVDWAARRRAWEAEIARAKERSEGYDCIIPVSGGKDSTWQTVTCLEAGLKPLCVTWRAVDRTEAGRANLENLIALGVDHIDFSVSPEVEKRFMIKALERFGSPAVPMHMALFGIPLQMAVRFRVPLVVWGENSAFEYGGEDELRFAGTMNREWLMTYGVTFGTTSDDWIDGDLSARDLLPYRWPTDEEMVAANVRAVFLGYFFNWDPERVRAIAEQHGFRGAAAPKTGFYDYADIDDHFISIHHWMKWYKFGFTRAFDNLSLEVRAGRLSRSEAIEKLRELGDQTPHEDIERLCAFLGISRTRFFELAERHRNHDVWVRTGDQWTIPDFLVPDWEWAT